jgi:hypothetical protein
MMRPPFSNVFFASGGPEAFLLPSSEIHIQNPVKRIAPVEFGQEGVKQGPDSTPLGGLVRRPTRQNASDRCRHWG